MKTTLIERYLISPDRLASTSKLMPYDPQSTDSLSQRSKDLESNEFPREFLSAALTAYNTYIGGDEPSLDNCQQIKNPKSTVIVTGQQAGLFSGPLYTIYKIATAIRLARDECQRTGRPVIPIFWNATEDHDISEIASCHFPSTQLQADFPKIGIAGERLDTQTILPLINQIIDLSPDPVKEIVTNILSCSTNDYGNYSSSVITRLFMGTGLVVLEPRLLRPHANSFFEEIIAKQPELQQALAKGADSVSTLGIEPAFNPNKGTGIFYINNDGIRRQILSLNGIYQVDGCEITRDELSTKLSTELDSFSTGAWLRPVLQSKILPVLAYIAGPSEFNYHLQLNEVFGALGTKMPPIRLRNHATILGITEARLVQKLDLKFEDFFRGPEPFYTTPRLPETYAALFSNSFSQLNDIGATLKADLSSLDLDRNIEGFLSKSTKDLEKIQTRVGKELERKAGVGNKQVDRLFQAVFPANVAQERRINLFYFLRSYDPTLISQIIDQFNPGELKHYVFTPE